MGNIIKTALKINYYYNQIIAKPTTDALNKYNLHIHLSIFSTKCGQVSSSNPFALKLTLL